MNYRVATDSNKAGDDRGSARALLSHPMAATWLILALSALATLVSTWSTYRTTVQLRDERFSQTVSRITAAIEDLMTPYTQLLRSAAAIYNINGELTVRDWESFAATVRLQEEYQGLQGIGFAKAILPTELDGHIAQMRKSRPDYSITPSEPRDFYTAITNLVPLDWRNDRAIGFDMFSEASRRNAMQAARDSGEVILSDAVVLVQETEAAPQKGMLSYLPVYKTRSTPSDVVSRRRELAGYIYAVFRMQDLFDASVNTELAKLIEHIGVKVLTAGPDERHVILFSGGDLTSDAISGTISPKAQFDIGVLGRSWQLLFFEGHEFRTFSERWLPWIVMTFGLMLAMLITSIAGVLARSRTQAIADNAALEVEVSARRQTQEALERANLQVQISNQELVHRVKNMMAVVSSIATQTARFTPNPSQFNAVFRDRLAALGRVHDFLKPNANYRPDLKDLVPEILSPYVNMNRKMVDIEGERLTIQQNVAVLLSVVLNELGSNAVRHGAWSAPMGRVKIIWSRVAGLDGPARLHFEWRESGGPAVSPPTRSGFGSHVTKFSIEQGLKGNFEQKFTPEGLICLWDIPVTGHDGSGDTPTRIY